MIKSGSIKVISHTLSFPVRSLDQLELYLKHPTQSNSLTSKAGRESDPYSTEKTACDGKKYFHQGVLCFVDQRGRDESQRRKRKWKYLPMASSYRLIIVVLYRKGVPILWTQSKPPKYNVASPEYPRVGE